MPLRYNARMRHDGSNRSFRWNWIIWACFAIGLGAIAWLQIRVERYNRGQQIAWVAAANHQMALSYATLSVVGHYQDTHRFGNPNKTTLEQFCKDCNGGRPLGEHGIWQDPATGGKVRIMDRGDGSFTAMPYTDFPPHALARYSDALWRLTSGLDALLFLACPVLCLLCISGFWEPPTTRRELGRWLVCLSFSLTFLGFLGAGTSPTAAKNWGLAFLVLGVLYLVHAMVSGREIDPTPRCAKCRYNLTGNASGVCPECGTPVDVSSIEAIVMRIKGANR